MSAAGLNKINGDIFADQFRLCAKIRLHEEGNDEGNPAFTYLKKCENKQNLKKKTRTRI